MPDRQSPRQEAVRWPLPKDPFESRRGREHSRERDRSHGARRGGTAHLDVPRLGIDLRASPDHARQEFSATPNAHASRFQWRPRRRRTRAPSYATTPTEFARTRRLGFRSVLLIALVVQAVLAVAAVWAVNSAQIKHLQVRGASDASVARAIAALPLTGCVIVRCDLARDLQAIEALPAVAHASITAVFPDTLIVSVALRTPALAWVTDAGTVVLSTDGVVLGPLDSDPAYVALRLPTVADASANAFAGAQPVAGARLDADLVNMAAQLRTGLVSALGNGWTLTYLSTIGLAAVAQNGMQIFFGDARAAAAMVSDDASAQTLGSPPALAVVTKGAKLQLDAAHGILQTLASRGETASRIDLRWGNYPDIVPTSG